MTKKLDYDNPKSAKKDWYSRAVFTVFDEHYTKKGKIINGKVNSSLRRQQHK